MAIQTTEVQRVVPVALLCGTFEEKLAKAAGLGYDGAELMTAEIPQPLTPRTCVTPSEMPVWS